MAEYRHVEAYCLMKYAAIDGSEVEWLWNSRDGVTPFCIQSRSGVEMRHVDWELDRRLPNYRPHPGERVFADTTPAVRAAHTERLLDAYWDDPAYPINEPGETREQCRERIAAWRPTDEGEPHVYIVGLDRRWEGQS